MHTDSRLNEALTESEAQAISIGAATVFQPRAPISTQEFFAGRWDQITSVVDAVAQTGLHIVLFGERGVGKTSLANIVAPVVSIFEEELFGNKASKRLFVKVNINSDDEFGAAWKRSFDEVYFDEDRPMIGFSTDPEKTRIGLREKLRIGDDPTIDDVRRTLSLLKGSVFIFDEFDRGGASLKKNFTDLVKALSDYAVDTTIIIVGVAETIDELMRDHGSIGRAIIQIQLPRMNQVELNDIISKASSAINVQFEKDAASLIIGMSQGLPHYTHLIGLHATREAAKRHSRKISKNDVVSSFEKAVHQAEQGIRNKYDKAVQSSHKDALYGDILLACASASAASRDPLGYFRPADVVEPLKGILKRHNVTIATFQRHINEFRERERGAILQRDGTLRSYKYRFSDPLLTPYIFMSAEKEKRDQLNWF